MPRPVRQDLHPTIYMRDTSTSKRLAERVVEDDLGVSVFVKRSTEYYYYTYKEFIDLQLAFIEFEEKSVPYDVLFFLLGNMEIADARRLDLPYNEHGEAPFRVVTPGCRVLLTQEEISDRLNCSQEKVRQAIKKLKELFIIVNSGNGWYELNAQLFWRGPEAFRQAYILVQREISKIEVFNSKDNLCE